MKTILTNLLLFVSLTAFAQLPDSVINRLEIPNPIQEYEERITDGASKTVITAEQIEARGYDNLDELLNSVQGLYITNDGIFTQIGIRGVSPTDANNQRVMVLLDNMPLNNPLSGQSSLGFDLRGINMEDIEKVIILRSPSAMMQGNNAMVGVIKIKTKKGKGVRLNFDTGSFGELDGGFALGQSFGKASFNLRGRIGNLSNQEYYTPTNDILNDAKENFGGLGFNFNFGNLSVNAFYNQKSEQIPIASTTPFEINPEGGDPDFEYFRNILDTSSVYNQNNFTVDVNYFARFKRQDINFRFYLNRVQSNRSLYYQDIELHPDTILLPDTTLLAILDTIGFIQFHENPAERALMIGVEYQHLFRINERHSFMIGTELWAIPISSYQQNNELYLHFDGNGYYTSDFLPEMKNYVDTLNADNSFEKYFSYWSTGLFANHTFQLDDKLTINTGLRFELNARTRPVLAPRFSIQYTPTGKTSLGFAYNRGYRIPSLVEAEISQIRFPEPNMNLTAEYVNSFDITLQQKITKGLDFNLSTYYIQLNDLIDKVKKTTRYDNIDPLSTLGIEGGLVMQLPQGVQTFINYNFNLSEERLVNMPQPLCKFGVTVPFLKHFKWYAEGLYEGGRRTASGVETLPYFLLNTNLLISPKFGVNSAISKYFRKVSFAFRAYNLLDQFYQHPSSIQPTVPLMIQNGRTWQTQLTLEF